MFGFVVTFCHHLRVFVSREKALKISPIVSVWEVEEKGKESSIKVVIFGVL